MTYPSKKDWWIIPVLLLLHGVGACLLDLAFSQAAPLPILLAGLVLSAVGGLVLWAYCSTSYDITPPDLLVRFGPLRWTIPLEGITQVERKNGLSPEWAWGAAWSLDRVVIQYRKRNGRRALLGVAVSPEDKEGFLRDLGAALLGLQRSGEKAGGAEVKAVVYQDEKE